jgi:hypothetical protein
MVLSNALSRRPDHCPEEDETKEEILLLDDLFLNLLDIDLRDRITNNKKYDFDVTKAIELLQEEGPMSIQNNLEDWKIEEVDDQKTIFYKGNNMFQRIKNYDKIFSSYSMTMKPQDTQEN